MSRTAIKVPRWRQERRQKELPFLELQPMFAVDSYEAECCGGYCGGFDGESITAFLSRNCPSPEDIASVFYGDIGGWVEAWVGLHTEECAACKRVMGGVIRKDHEMREAPIDYFF